MAVPFSNTKLRVPQGFQTLIEMLSKEILREQPKNIYEYSATYLEKIIKDKGNFLAILKNVLQHFVENLVRHDRRVGE
jgi:hypothetical protein